MLFISYSGVVCSFLAPAAHMQIETPRDLGLRIRDQRLRLRMTQAELARSIGASRSWVIQMERGNPGAEIGLVLKALKALGLMMGVNAGEETARGPQADVGSLHRVDLAWILDRARERLP